MAVSSMPARPLRAPARRFGKKRGDLRGQVTEEITLADVDAVVAQDRVGGDHVEIERRYGKALQVAEAGQVQWRLAEGDLQRPRLATLELLRLQRFQEGHD